MRTESRAATSWSLGALLALLVAVLVGPAAAQDVVWEEDWETPGWDERWAVDAGVWEVGAPTSGPGGAYQAQNCAATVLHGNYPDGASTRLYTYDWIDVPSASENPRLRFWHWFSCSSYDYGYVQVQPEGGEWTQLGDSYASVSSGVWTRPSLDLSAYAGQRIRVAFYFYSASPNTSSGWYVDQLTFDGLHVSVPAIACPTEPAEVTACDSNLDVCIALPISNAETVSVVGATWADNELCFSATGPGSYGFRVTATNQAGSDTCNVEIDVSVSSEPDACFSASPASGYAPMTVSFSDCSTPESGLTHSWDFGDGNTGVEAEPTHVFAAPGTYTVRLAVDNVCGTDSTEQIIVVEEASLAHLGFYPDSAFVQPASVGIPTTIELRIGSAEAVMGVLAEIAFDPERLNISDVKLGDFLQSNDGQVFDQTEVDNENGVLSVSLGVLGGDPPGVSGVGTLLTIEFTAVAEDPTSQLIFNSASLRDTTNQSIPLETENGVVLLADDLLGDFDADRDVDFADFTYFVWCWNAYPECMGADLAGPITGSAPPPPPWSVSSYPYGPDGSIDFEDLMVFVQMYNWSGRFESTLPVPPLAGWRAAALAQGAVLPMAMGVQTVEVGERFAVDLEIPDGAGLRGFKVELLFSRETLAFRGTSLDVLPEGAGTGIYTLRRDTNRGVEICGVVLGRPGEVSLSQSRVELYFEAIAEAECCPVVLGEVELRTDVNGVVHHAQAQGQPAWTVRVGGTGAEQRLALWQNAPNPFAGNTMIRFDIPRPMPAEVVIFDVQGRRVRTIVSDLYQAGTHEVTWDGRAEDGSLAASGIYFCGLKTADREVRRRMLLTR